MRMAPFNLEELTRLRPRLVRFAQRRLPSLEQAEDAVQETLVAAIEGSGRYAGASSPSTWLFGILKHKITDCQRGAAREKHLAIDDEQAAPAEGGPEETYALRNFMAVVDGSLARLPAKGARAFLLREVWGADTHEVCDEMGITPSNCWVLVHRARERLRRCPDICLLAGKG